MFSASGGCEWNNATTDSDMEVDMEVDDQMLGDVRVLFLLGVYLVCRVRIANAFPMTFVQCSILGYVSPIPVIPNFFILLIDKSQY